MKRYIFLFIMTCCILLVGCFETTQEVTINKNGSGIFTNTTDLSNMIGLLKQMGGDEANKMQNTDTTISLAGIADSIAGLTAEQRRIVNKGTMKLTLNMQDEKLLVKLDFPFEKLSEVELLKEILPKLSVSALKKLPGGDQMPAGAADADSSNKIKTFDNFFDDTFSKKLISRTLNKAKYATAADDEFMKSLQQMSGMGSPITVNYIINLPRAAKKAEGKAVKLSDDKKKVTVSVTSDDFFNDPSKFEYRIEF
jgi:hypothetical protein